MVLREDFRGMRRIFGIGNSFLVLFGFFCVFLVGKRNFLKSFQRLFLRFLSNHLRECGNFTSPPEELIFRFQIFMYNI